MNQPNQIIQNCGLLLFLKVVIRLLFIYVYFLKNAGAIYMTTIGQQIIIITKNNDFPRNITGLLNHLSFFIENWSNAAPQIHDETKMPTIRYSEINVSINFIEFCFPYRMLFLRE